MAGRAITAEVDQPAAFGTRHLAEDVVFVLRCVARQPPQRFARLSAGIRCESRDVSSALSAEPRPLAQDRGAVRAPTLDGRQALVDLPNDLETELARLAV